MSTKYILSRRTCFVTNKLILFHAVRSLCSYITLSVPPPPFDIHDDVIKWKHFRVTGPLCGEFTAPGEFPSQRPMTRSFYGFFDLHLNKQLNKQSRGWWFETLSRSLWRHRNVSWVTPKFAPLFTMGLLPDTQNCWCACAGNAGNVFPVTAGKRSRHTSRHVRHARAVMHAGIAN